MHPVRGHGEKITQFSTPFPPLSRPSYRPLHLKLNPVDFHLKVLLFLDQSTWTEVCKMHGTAADLYRDIESKKLYLSVFMIKLLMFS